MFELQNNQSAFKLHISHFSSFQEARKSIRFYQNIKPGHDYLVEEKIAQLQHQINDAVAKKSINNSGNWSDLFRNPGRKAMMIGIALASLMHFSGSYAMISYAGTIFQGFKCENFSVEKWQKSY